MNPIPPVQNTNNIRYADFVRITTQLKTNAGSFVVGNTYTILFLGTTDWNAIGVPEETTPLVGMSFIATDAGSGTGVATIPQSYRFATTAAPLTIPAVDSEPFSALGILVKVGDAQRDIKSTANETTFSLVGIDTAMLGFVLGQQIKGSKIEAWKGFFDTDGNLITTGGTGGLYQFFNGYISTFSITEQWLEEARQFVGVISVAASSIQLILQNRVAGRYTNDNSWQFFAPGDTSMERVAFITTINYPFGKEG